MASSSTEFVISRELRGHEGAVRAICQSPAGHVVTGSMDCSVRFWKLENDSSLIGSLTSQKEGEVASSLTLYEHWHWVTALTSMPPGVLPDCPEGGIVSGSMDNMIRIYSLEGTLVRELVGHIKGVISLSWTLDGNLISGSWDESARIWDVKTATCLATLEGHENGVCVLGLSDGNVATGSTGRQEGDSIVDYQIRIWKDFKVVKSVRDHQGAIRQLVIVPGFGFLSCSNDGTIRLRSNDGSSISLMQLPGGAVSFLLGATRLSSGELVAATDEGSAVIWSPDGTVLQIIGHPAGLWCVASLANGDFVTGCEDKVARVFTREPVRGAPDSLREAFNRAVLDAQTARERAGQSVDVSTLKKYDNRFSYSGKRDGAVQMFDREGKAWACSWNSASKTWIDIGEVTGTGSGGVVDGESFDMVIPVEIEDPATGGVRKLEIGYNQSDNPFQAAQDFINKNNLNQAYLQQIADYIIQRSKNYQAPIIGLGPGDAGPSLPSLEHIPPKPEVYFVFDAIKLEPALQKIIELNKSSPPPPVVLTEDQLTTLKDTVDVLQATSRWHASEFSGQQVNVLAVLALQWPLEKLFPVVDLLRVLAIHPQGAATLVSHPSNLLQRIISLSQETEAPMAISLLSLRVLANLFTNGRSRPEVLASVSRSEYLISIRHLSSHPNKNVRLSLATLLFNMSIAVKESGKEDHMLTQKEMLSLASSTIRNSREDEDIIYRSTVAIGTSFYYNGSCPEELQSELLALTELVEGLGGSSRLQGVCQDLRALTNYLSRR